MTNQTYTAPTENASRDIEPIRRGLLGYLQQHQRTRLYDFVFRLFAMSGLTIGDLAARLDLPADRVGYMMASPHLWTLEAVSDLLYAINGSQLEFSVGNPFPVYQTEPDPTKPPDTS